MSRHAFFGHEVAEEHAGSASPDEASGGGMVNLEAGGGMEAGDLTASIGAEFDALLAVLNQEPAG